MVFLGIGNRYHVAWSWLLYLLFAFLVAIAALVAASTLEKTPPLLRLKPLRKELRIGKKPPLFCLKKNKNTSFRFLFLDKSSEACVFPYS